MGLETATKELAALSISTDVNEALAVGTPATALLAPLASVKLPIAVPLIVAASLVPVIVTVTTFCEPSALDTVIESA